MSEDDLGNAVNAMPFLANRRLVVLANPSSKYNNPAARKKFLEFVVKTPDTARLVMHESLDPREAEKHWLVKWAEKNEKTVQARAFMLPRLKEMTGWIVNESKNQGGKIDPRAAEMLKEMVGVDTRQAGMEIAKLLAYANWERPITSQDVEAVCVVTSEQSVFDFVDAFGVRRREEMGVRLAREHRRRERHDRASYGHRPRRARAARRPYCPFAPGIPNFVHSSP